MSDPIIDPSHAIPAASQLRRSRFRWRIVAFIALVIAILASVATRRRTSATLRGVVVKYMATPSLVFTTVTAVAGT